VRWAGVTWADVNGNGLEVACVAWLTWRDLGLHEVHICLYMV
jgi:hypothetical protein